MLSLLNKRRDAAAAPAMPNWHADFRNREALPDIKAIRTAFWINGPAIFIALALGLYLGIREWQLHLLQGQIADVTRQIQKQKRPSEQAVAMFKKFQAEEARINEVN